MEINEIKNNLNIEKKILEQVLVLDIKKQASKDYEKIFFSKAINSILEQFRIINDSTREGIIKGDFGERVTKIKKEKIILGEEQVTIKKEDKPKLLEELKITEEALSRIKKRKEKKVKEYKKEEMKISKLISFSSRLFLKRASKLSKKIFYVSLNQNMRKANIPILISSYISMMLFATMLVFFISLFLAIVFSFIKIGFSVGTFFPAMSVSTKGIASRLLRNMLISLSFPLATFFLFYLYPAQQASSIKNKIENELPFAIIHMSAIAGSGVEPVKVFSIIAISPEYPAVSSEIKKLMNMINLYGYDLVTALKETSKSTSNEKLGSLFNGIANVTVSGGDLRDYLDKRASDTLLDYKLQKKAEATIAETAMDLYIGILIAAPLILMVMLVIMGAVPGLGFKGLSTKTLSFLVIAGIVLLNVGFLIFLKMKKKG